MRVCVRVCVCVCMRMCLCVCNIYIYIDDIDTQMDIVRHRIGHIKRGGEGRDEGERRGEKTRSEKERACVCVCH